MILLSSLICFTGCHSLPPSGEARDSIASYMARMESAMDFLFRNIEQPSKRNQNIVTVQALLNAQKKAAELIPDTSDDPHTKVSRIRLRRYRVRSLESIQFMTELLDSLEQGNLKRAQELLLKLDQHRRDCHVEFG